MRQAYPEQALDNYYNYTTSQARATGSLFKSAYDATYLEWCAQLIAVEPRLKPAVGFNELPLVSVPNRIPTTYNKRLHKTKLTPEMRQTWLAHLASLAPKSQAELHLNSPFVNQETYGYYDVFKAANGAYHLPYRIQKRRIIDAEGKTLINIPKGVTREVTDKLLTACINALTNNEGTQAIDEEEAYNRKMQELYEKRQRIKELL